MDLLLLTVLIAAFLPYVWVFVGGALRARREEGFDNRYPRQQAARMEGLGARAYGAQQNAWEALAVYAPVALVAHLADAPAAAAETTGLLFLIARVAHGLLYLADLPTLRSLVWTFGWGCCIYLAILAA